MIMNISKEFNWDMSHRLPFHDGHCKNIHGHTYKLRVEIEGIMDKNGMVMDYYVLEKIVSQTIKKLDHSFIVDKNDNIMLDFLKENNFKHYLIENSTTAENIVIHLSNIFIPLFKRYKNLTSLKVRLYETANVFAEVEFDLND